MCLRDFCSGVQDSWLVSGPSCEAPYITVTLQNEKKKKIVPIVVCSAYSYKLFVVQTFMNITYFSSSLLLYNFFSSGHMQS